MKRVPFLIVMIVWAVVCVGPLIWMVANAFRGSNEIFLQAVGAPEWARRSNFSDAWQQGDLGRALLISLLVSLASTLVCGVCSALAGFALSRGRLPLTNVLFTFLLLGLMIPTFSTLIPVLTQFQQAGLTDSPLGLILVYAGFSVSLGVFLFKNAFDQVPKEYLEAASIDGASVPWILWRIALPAVKPTIATFAILTFLSAYNDFVFALVLIAGEDSRTLPLALLQFSGRFGTRYDLVFAALTIGAIPALATYLFLRAQIQRGVAMGGRVA
ncbi:carbohydrate ABC transporter permease [Streptosporangium sp. CA-135522]|uniref:carbohydrate ABC transporter permease n=1 Tax=Streptosporangium sp. CA-135522 TaxID=3240072 RepID=UPI003D931D07